MRWDRSATIGTMSNDPGDGAWTNFGGNLVLDRPTTLVDGGTAPNGRTSFSGVISGNVGTLSIRGGRVTLSARRALGEVRLDVSDTGRGVPFHVQAHIFDRFVGRDRGGPGLGLALVKALVELHGGWVALESEPGAGSTFTCHLPETQQPGAMQPELGF